MKIAYFINEYPKVSHSFIRREIHALERQGFDIQRVALRGWQGHLPDEGDRRERERTQYVLRDGAWCLIRSLIVRAFRSPVRVVHALRIALRLGRSSDRGFLYHLAYLAEACRLLAWTSEFGARHVHAHFGTNSAAVALFVHALGGPPFSFTAHGPEEFQRPLGLRDKIHHAQFVVAVSSFGRSQLYLQAALQDWPKIQVTRCGLEASDFAPSSSPVPDSTTLLCVGRLADAKGQLLLIDAAARLAARRIPFQLVLAGDGPLRAAITQRLRELSLESCIRITGWISSEQVRSELLAARALVLPSFAEGLPVVLMEAMAQRRPVIATYIAGIPELVTPGETGWLVPAGCIDSLATAMEQCLSCQPSELQRMGDAGFDRVVRGHSIDRSAAELARLIRPTDLCAPQS